ncbi:MAG: Rhomboid family protein [Parcubacteria group bacterium Gr01-1014_106]|nr:MAG: Rhomboid family protein [Parcubacteria group bacterium Gr01-1014_106]
MLPIRDHERSERFPFVTIGIIALNAWVFFQELTAPSLERFIEQWALIPALVDFSNLSSLLPFLTSQFLHAGIAHILFNMWYLWIFGDNVESHLGHIRFLLFYLAAGVVAGLVQFFFLVGSPIPMLGASGAVAGVLGAYWVLFPRHRVDTLVPGFFTTATLPASIVLLFWFIGQLFSGIGSLGVGSAATGGVAWWAHIGGFVFGWLTAQLARRTLRHDHPPHAHSAENIDIWK